jgi:pimeloyl-ACP methyl ester carboxylesterase
MAMFTPPISPTTAPKLDPREEHFHIPSPHEGLSLFLRLLPADGNRPCRGVLLYIHGATFPSALSIAHRFDGRSWRDELCEAGFHVWGLDLHGFGQLSDPYPEMDEPAKDHAPLGRVRNAAPQVKQAARFICAHHEVARLSLIAHSWGSLVAGRFAQEHPELMDRLVLFGPITRRQTRSEAADLMAWRLITIEEQWNRFIADVPAGEPPVLLRRHFEDWAGRYLDTDPASRTRNPAAVKVPSGPYQDIADAWASGFPYDPALITCPVAIIRGEWDSLCDDDDARWLFTAFTSAPVRRDIKIGRGTHLMHLESSRYALYRETEAFLLGRDIAPRTA